MMNRGDRRSGQMVAFVSVSLFFLFSVMGLSVDLGYSYFVKIYAQAASDAAASAAAIYATNILASCGAGITCNSTFTCANPPTAPPTTAFEAGCLYAKANGFVNASPQSVTLIANNTATPNESTNVASMWIQANVSQTVPHLFLYWAGFHSGSVATQSIAGVTIIPNSSCVYVLDTSATSAALGISGATTLTTTGCGVYVNSSHSSAISLTGSSHIVASQVTERGSYSLGGTSSISPSPVTGAPAVTDPFLNIPAPAVPNSCWGSTATTPYSLGNSNTATIYPSTDTVNSGVFCGGITVNGSATLTMSPGIYYLNGGGFTISNQGTVNGTGVTIYMTALYGKSPGPMQIIGNGIANLSAQASGTYQGILFYQDRTASVSGTANQIGNSATLNTTGTLYFPQTKLLLSGAVSPRKMGIVVKDLTMTGSATFQQDTTGTFTGLITRSPTLIQ